MVETRQGDRLVFALTVAVSVLVHGTFLLLLLFLAVPRALEPPAERVMAVDIVSPDQFATLQRPPPSVPVPAPQAAPILAAAAPERLPPSPTIPARVPASPSRGQRVQAADFYAAGILSDPANADLRRNFGELANSEQLIQLCNIEALEQIGRDQNGPAPDVVVGYAFGDLEVAGTTLVADGGAYRQKDAWFRVHFECTSNPQMTAITSFDYMLGDSVPRGEWEEHFLNADDEGLDP